MLFFSAANHWHLFQDPCSSLERWSLFYVLTSQGKFLLWKTGGKVYYSSGAVQQIKGLATQAWRLEFSSRIHNRKRELTPKTCPLTTHAIACAFTHTSHTCAHSHKECIFNLKCILRLLNICYLPSEICNLILEDGAMHIITIEQWYCVVLTTTTDDQIVRQHLV